jgi:hypothetical protein
MVVGLCGCVWSLGWVGLVSREAKVLGLVLCVWCCPSVLCGVLLCASVGFKVK